jgi:hypothetical protein
MSSTQVPSRHLLVRLQRDWDRLKHSPRSLDHARQWRFPSATGSSDRSLETLETLDDVLAWAGYGRSASHDDDDQVLGHLVRLAADDQLAGRVVLQRLLPGISAIARRRSGPGRPHHELLDEVVASAWAVIRTYPVDRRHTFVAVGMLREIDYQTFRRAHRKLTTFVPHAASTFDERPAPDAMLSAADELNELLVVAAAAGVEAGDIELARRLGRGESTREVARSTKVTDRTVRNRRDVVIYRLRAVALASS